MRRRRLTGTDLRPGILPGLLDLLDLLDLLGVLDAELTGCLSGTLLMLGLCELAAA